MAVIDPSLADKARHWIPAFSHDRPLTLRRRWLVE
jgi:hypothetical protein